MKKFIALLMLIILSLSGCSFLTGNDVGTGITDMGEEVIPVREEEVQQDLIAFADAFMMTWITQSPLNATFTFGDLEAEGLGHLLHELDDYDMASFQANAATLKETYDQLMTYDYEDLTPEEQNIYELMEFQLQSAIESEDYTLYGNSFNPSFGIQVSIPLSLSQIELETKDEVEAYIDRVAAVPELMKEAMALEEEKADASLLLPDFIYEATIEQIEEMSADGPEVFMITQSFNDRMDQADFLTEEEKTAYSAEVLSIVEDEILPTYDEMAHDLGRIKEFDSNTLGTSEWEDSEGYYEWLMFTNTSYRFSVREMRRWLEDESATSFEALNRHVEENPGIYDELSALSDFNLPTLEEATEFGQLMMESHLEDYGVLSAEEEVIPAYLENHLPSGFYFATSIDGEDYGTMYLQEDSFSDLDIQELTTLLHENVPGHHLYFSVLYNSDAPFIQKMSDWSAYAEGWAVYVQDYAFEAVELSEEVKTYLMLYMKFAYIQEMLMDISIHVDGISRESVIDYLLQQGATQESAEKNYNRMLSNPGEVFKYYYSYLKFRDYRAQFEEVLGEAFDEKEFHSFMLDHINLPYTTMDRLVAESLGI